MRCSIAMGFHGMSKLISVLQNCMLRPSPPDSVHSSTGTRSRKAAMAASFWGPDMPPSNSANGDPVAAQQVGQMGQTVAMMDEHQLLLRRVVLQQVEQRRLLRPGRNGGIARRQLRPGGRRLARVPPGVATPPPAAAASGDDPAALSRWRNASRLRAGSVAAASRTMRLSSS